VAKSELLEMSNKVTFESEAVESVESVADAEAQGIA
jgi:hypothetical protein